MDKEIISKFIILMNELQSKNSKNDIIKEIVFFLRNHLNIFSIGVRIQDGDDFPFYFTIGFTDKFLKAENFLCCRDNLGNIVKTTSGESKLECMCGSIIRKQIPLEKKCLNCFTKFGGFKTNSVDQLVKETGGDIGIKTRGTCVESGYKSVAIIPIPFKGKNIGLIQLNDFYENKFTDEIISSIEAIAILIGNILGNLDIQNKVEEDKKQIIRQNIKNIIVDIKSMSERILKDS
jgi:hypothetical protein